MSTSNVRPFQLCGRMAIGWCGLDVEAYHHDIGDEELLDWGRRDGLVVTNGADFVELARTASHAGVIMYQQYGHSAGTFVRAIARIDRYLTPEHLRDHVEWLENWL